MTETKGDEGDVESKVEPEVELKVEGEEKTRLVEE